MKILGGLHISTNYPPPFLHRGHPTFGIVREDSAMLEARMMCALGFKLWGNGDDGPWGKKKTPTHNKLQFSILLVSFENKILLDEYQNFTRLF